MKFEDYLNVANYIKEKIDFKPKVAIVLGSGLGGFVEKVKVEFELDYKDIPNFPISTVSGHKGRFVFGYIGKEKVVIMQGRVHFYEGYSMEQVTMPIRVMKLLGAEILLLTNASGGINRYFKAGDLMIIQDHISSFIKNPLIGKNIDEFGERFPDMSEVYRKSLIKKIEESGKRLNINLKKGVYVQLSGPSYETPSEIKMLSLLGADAVGMSTVCEAIIGNYCGFKVCGISCVTNMASGVSKNTLNHKEVEENAKLAGKKFSDLIYDFIENLEWWDMIRLYNCKVLTLDGNFEVLKDYEVWVKEGKIFYVGKKRSDIENFDFEREIDCCKNLVMPGFKNAHTHSPMTFLRSYADDLPLDKWLNEAVFPMERKLSEEMGLWFSYLAILEYLESGITSIFDMYFLQNSVAKAIKDTGFSGVLCGAVNNFVSSVEEMEEMFKKYNNFDEKISYKMGFHAEYTTSLEILKKIALLTKKYNVGIATHCSETKKEVEECISRYNKTPVELFLELGLLENNAVLFHCNYLSEKDMEIIKEKNVFVVTNPGSNCKLASGIAEIKKMVEMGIKVAIGTDGSASNNSLNMFKEMYLTSVLQKVKNKDASAIKPESVIEMACVNGAKALGIDSDCIKEGKNADLIIIDLKKPNMQPINSIVKNIVYSGSAANVSLTMVRGKILYEKGKYNIGIEPEIIYKKCNDFMESIKNWGVIWLSLKVLKTVKN